MEREKMCTCSDVEGNCYTVNMAIRIYRLEDMEGCFDVFLTVHHSIDLFHLPSLMHNSFIH